VAGAEGIDGGEFAASFDDRAGDRQDIAGVVGEEPLEPGEPLGHPRPGVEQVARLDQRRHRNVHGRRRRGGGTPGDLVERGGHGGVACEVEPVDQCEPGPGRDVEGSRRA
jgi:hypothetical protein